VKDIKQILC